MLLHDKVAQLRKTREQAGIPPVPTTLLGVSKERVRKVLTQLTFGSNQDLVDVVFALLDNQTDSWFDKPPKDAHFCDGASTAHLACHVGILQRNAGKLDREGRDYWIKPLRELGGIEPIYLFEDSFIDGHQRAKSPNCAYRLSQDFKAILQASADQWGRMLNAWNNKDAARARLEFQAKAAAAAQQLIGTSGHSSLIQASVSFYAKQFLPGYKIIYVDDGDGDRITDEDRSRLKEAGIELRLADAMPDALLWNPATDWLWVIEAVTSDGEVDLHKKKQLESLCARCGKAGIGFTTSYRTWKEAATRQGKSPNIAVDTYIWIQEDSSKHFFVASFPQEASR